MAHDMTILEAARALGYTKNAVKYQVGKLTEKEVYKDQDGVLRIRPAGIKTLQARMGKKADGSNQATTGKEPPNNQATTTKEPDNNQATTGKEKEGEPALYSALLLTIETLQEQLRVKDEQIANYTRLLDQQQHLQAAQLKAINGETTSEPPEPAASHPEEKKRGFFGLFRK